MVCQKKTFILKPTSEMCGACALAGHDISARCMTTGRVPNVIVAHFGQIHLAQDLLNAIQSNL
jgi:hypothetical protein